MDMQNTRKSIIFRTTYREKYLQYINMAGLGREVNNAQIQGCSFEREIDYC
jgi:hypothetical protein